ncbi:MAG: M3 family metallopeptidase [Stagnimonas sp.]|nr:M3 family metallopeptidase [Stagnimonas sp.]
MTRHTALLPLCGLLLAIAMPTHAAQTDTLPATNPFAQVSTLPYALPPFDRIKDADYRPAFDAGMAEQLREVAAIASNPAAPTFDNTLVALEKSGQLLNRVSTVFFSLAAANSNLAMDALRAELSPQLATHQDSINLNTALFARIKAVYDARNGSGLDAESLQLVERYHTQFVRAGALLSEAQKTQLKAMNAELSSLGNSFRQNVLNATKDGAVSVSALAELDGLSEPQIAAAADAARQRGLTGQWLITLQNTTTQPALTQLKNRALRERLYKASVNRAPENFAVVAKIVKLRAERAALLGYPNHAAYVVADETAQSTAAVNRALTQLAPAAFNSAKAQAAEMQKLIDAEAKTNKTKPFKLQPWDWQIYAEQLRKARYDFDDAAVKPYFELNRVLVDGVFYAATQLYGITFKERTDLPVYQKDVRVFEIYDRDGSPMALFLSDNYARDNKQGGAWMNNYVDQSKLFNAKPVIANHLNIPKPPEGQPTLLTADETRTLFHEFGHALHGLFSEARYPYLSGTNVPRDFVEYPSQANEMWASDPTVLAHFAKHYQTGEAIPQALLDKLAAAGKFNQGFSTGEALAATLLDQAWHQITAAQAPAAKDVMAFEAAALKKAGVDFAPVAPRYHTPYFSHVFAGGYSAGYYAYTWTAVLAADTEQWFDTHGGLQRANGDFYRAKILSRGGTVDAATLFREFYGAEPDIAPLAEKRGLLLGSGKAKK